MEIGSRLLIPAAGSQRIEVDAIVLRRSKVPTGKYYDCSSMKGRKIVVV